MNTRVELPIVEPLYQTHQFQGMATAIIEKNPSIKNWYLSEAINLLCSRRFLSGFTSPQINIANSHWTENPFIEKIGLSTRFLKGFINPAIREMLDQGYYVIFDGVDDYYVEGKSWYQERHFCHDGLICGYDRKEKTYCLYAYDSNWKYEKFWTSQESFNMGRIAMQEQGVYGTLHAVKVKSDFVKFEPVVACHNICDYLSSDLERYPFDGEGDISGIVVHLYIHKYLEKLQNGEIPYQRMDRRVFRMIWEQKKVMLEGLTAIEGAFNIAPQYSKMYEPLVRKTDVMRMLYASHHLKRRDSILPLIQKNITEVMEQEKTVLTALIDTVEREGLI